MFLAILTICTASACFDGSVGRAEETEYRCMGVLAESVSAYLAEPVAGM